MNAPATQPTMNVGAFSIDILVQGFPGKTVCHGGLGWSTVALVRGEGKVILIDSGNFGMRRLISERLSAHGLTPADVTDVILTHAHYDHVCGMLALQQAYPVEYWLHPADRILLDHLSELLRSAPTWLECSYHCVASERCRTGARRDAATSHCTSGKTWL